MTSAERKLATTGAEATRRGKRRTGFRRPIVLIVAAAGMALIASPAASSASDGARATASASVKKQVKRVKKQVKKLKQANASLDQQVAELQGERGDPRPPSGQAGGDLSGSYPNPSIAEGAVTSGKLATIRRPASALSGSGFPVDAVASCDPGEKVVGGGGFWDQQAGDETATQDLHIVNSFPATSPSTGRDSWVVTGFNATGSIRTLFARAICVRTG